MKTLKKDIQILPGATDILLVAPHGLAEDDENTDRVTLQTAKRLACTAIINSGLPRNTLDLNNISEAARHPFFIQTLKRFLESAGRSRVVWIHGMKDESAASEARHMKIKTPIHCLIGYGLPDRLTAAADTITKLAAVLSAAGLNTVVAADRSSKFRGYSANNMNQWFRKNRYPLARLESWQLELSWSGVREEAYISKTAAILAAAFNQLMRRS